MTEGVAVERLFIPGIAWIGMDDVFHRVTMQVFVGDHFPMIAAPVQCDVDRIPKGSHCVSVSRYSQLSFSKASELVRDGAHTAHR